MSGRIRTIKPEWLEDEKLAMASSDARVLSIAILLLADDYGNGRANEVQLCGTVFPGVIRDNPRDARETLAKALEELARLSFVVLYEVDGQHYFHVRNWEKHQRVDHPGKPRVPGFTEGNTTLWNFRESLGNSSASLAPDHDHDHDHDQGPTTTTSRTRAHATDGTQSSPAQSDAESAQGASGTSTATSPATDTQTRATGPSTPQQSASGGNPASPGTDNDRETICPTNLVLPTECVADIASKLGVETADVLAVQQEFVAYWTFGGGAGKRRRNWVARLRQEVLEKHKRGQLAGSGSVSDNATFRRSSGGNFVAENMARARRVMKEMSHDR